MPPARAPKRKADDQPDILKFASSVSRGRRSTSLERRKLEPAIAKKKRGSHASGAFLRSSARSPNRIRRTQFTRDLSQAISGRHTHQHVTGRPSPVSAANSCFPSIPETSNPPAVTHSPQQAELDQERTPQTSTAHPSPLSLGSTPQTQQNHSGGASSSRHNHSQPTLSRHLSSRRTNTPTEPRKSQRIPKAGLSRHSAPSQRHARAKPVIPSTQLRRNASRNALCPSASHDQVQSPTCQPPHTATKEPSNDDHAGAHVSDACGQHKFRSAKVQNVRKQKYVGAADDYAFSAARPESPHEPVKRDAHPSHHVETSQQRSLGVKEHLSPSIPAANIEMQEDAQPPDPEAGWPPSPFARDGFQPAVPRVNVVSPKSTKPSRRRPHARYQTGSDFRVFRERKQPQPSASRVYHRASMPANRGVAPAQHVLPEHVRHDVCPRLKKGSHIEEMSKSVRGTDDRWFGTGGSTGTARTKNDHLANRQADGNGSSKRKRPQDVQTPSTDLCRRQCVQGAKSSNPMNETQASLDPTSTVEPAHGLTSERKVVSDHSRTNLQDNIDLTATRSSLLCESAEPDLLKLTHDLPHQDGAPTHDVGECNGDKISGFAGHLRHGSQLTSKEREVKSNGLLHNGRSQEAMKDDGMGPMRSPNWNMNSNLRELERFRALEELGKAKDITKRLEEHENLPDQVPSQPFTASQKNLVRGMNVSINGKKPAKRQRRSQGLAATTDAPPPNLHLQSCSSGFLANQSRHHDLVLPQRARNEHSLINSSEELQHNSVDSPGVAAVPIETQEPMSPSEHKAIQHMAHASSANPGCNIGDGFDMDSAVKTPNGVPCDKNPGRNRLPDQLRKARLKLKRKALNRRQPKPGDEFSELLSTGKLGRRLVSTNASRRERLSHQRLEASNGRTHDIDSSVRENRPNRDASKERKEMHACDTLNKVTDISNVNMDTQDGEPHTQPPKIDCGEVTEDVGGKERISQNMTIVLSDNSDSESRNLQSKSSKKHSLKLEKESRNQPRPGRLTNRRDTDRDVRCGRNSEDDEDAILPLNSQSRQKHPERSTFDGAVHNSPSNSSSRAKESETTGSRRAKPKKGGTCLVPKLASSSHQEVSVHTDTKSLDDRSVNSDQEIATSPVKKRFSVLTRGAKIPIPSENEGGLSSTPTKRRATDTKRGKKVRSTMSSPVNESSKTEERGNDVTGMPGSSSAPGKSIVVSTKATKKARSSMGEACAGSTQTANVNSPGLINKPSDICIDEESDNPSSSKDGCDSSDTKCLVKVEPDPLDRAAKAVSPYMTRSSRIRNWSGGCLEPVVIDLTEDMSDETVSGGRSPIDEAIDGMGGLGLHDGRELLDGDRRRGFLENLSDQEGKVLDIIFKSKMDNEKIASVPGTGISLRRGDVKRLRGTRWLNDEVMNAYVALINRRNDDLFGGEVPMVEGIPRTFMFNTYFYTRLCSTGYDYRGVSRWTKRAKLNVVEQDLILVPVNLGNHHWVLSGIDMKYRDFLYLDSMREVDRHNIVKTLKQWLKDELKDKLDAKMCEGMDVDSWTVLENKYRVRRNWKIPGQGREAKDYGPSGRISTIPKQGDGGSCGVFTAKIADCLALGLRVYFNQRSISLVRHRMALDLFQMSLLS